MYFETSEKLNGTFPLSPRKGRGFEIPWGGAHIIVSSSYATIFFTRIYHHTTVTLTVCIITARAVSRVLVFVEKQQDYFPRARRIRRI
jgi:hypothetical protein